MRRRLRVWAGLMRRDVVALGIAARDPRVPLRAKLLAGVVVAYALSPIDLIPDFIPILGAIDDLVLVPAGIWLTLRLIPDDLMDEFRVRAAHTKRRATRWAVATVIVVLLMWVMVLALIWWVFFR